MAIKAEKWTYIQELRIVFKCANCEAIIDITFPVTEAVHSLKYECAECGFNNEVEPYG